MPLMLLLNQPSVALFFLFFIFLLTAFCFDAKLLGILLYENEMGVRKGSSR
jgi:hypothetical protein